ncbi:MAG: tetratricopeptide repeat protein [Polyangiaceae bacterium]
MRKADACAFALASSLLSSPAGAQQAPKHPGKVVTGSAGAQEAGKPGDKKGQPLNLHRELRGAQAEGEVGRTRMRSGDWTGALDAFDHAIEGSPDPSLRRDRGQCHEKLGHPYPAIDDYRAYLTAAPEAPDADAIRDRLVKLEQDTLGYSSASTDVPGDVEGGASAAAAGKARTGTAGAAKGRGEEMDYVEREDDPLGTPLRRGKGWSAAPFFSLHKWGLAPARVVFAPAGTSTSSSFSDSGSWAECVGLQARYSLGPSAALFLEAAYEHFNSTAFDFAIVSGLSSQVAFELRFPLDASYDNQLIVAPGLGYEHLLVQPGLEAISGSLGGFVPRVRLAWRRLLAHSAGLELALDGGAVNFFAYSAFPFDSSHSTTFFLGLNVALLWGL